MRRKEWKCVYVILFSDNIVKVGVSKDFESRIKIHKMNTHLDYIKYYTTEKCSNAFTIEKAVKKHFRKYARYGAEWLDVSFDTVKEFVEKTFNEIAEFADTTKVDEESLIKFSKMLKSGIEKGENAIDEYREHEAEILKTASDCNKEQHEINKELIKSNKKLIDCAVYAQNMLRYTLWYMEETCRDNMMYSEFMKFKKEFEKTSEKIKRP